ncbi:ALG13 [[Candida] subhashii]|uniref:UDP-N-acetylglucosamine transferase subunit ALG13 n=1 Tax=[Candida] subhashii TaxID=561895 RepID=A0A8J5QG30_9ASCO|nr:ALG13 [[Candida] subhashii]KAG7661389.1 ALG13 [[Candida] subhashii]
MFTVVVTTGATVTFTSLIEKIVDAKFIQELKNIKVTKLIIQFGNEVVDSIHISELFFSKQIREKNILETLQLSDTENGRVKSEVKHYSSSTFEIIAFPYSRNIDEYIQQADVVITHAGTGSIIDTLRNHKKLMVVVNDKLMDNHQLEIANEFSKLEHCLSYQVNEVNDSGFINDLKQLLNNEIKLEPLADNDGNVMEAIIYDELMK